MNTARQRKMSMTRLAPVVAALAIASAVTAARADQRPVPIVDRPVPIAGWDRAIHCRGTGAIHCRRRQWSMSRPARS